LCHTPGGAEAATERMRVHIRPFGPSDLILDVYLYCGQK
jgi:hypothetical protein